MASVFDALIGITTKFDSAGSMRELNRFAADIGKKLGDSTQKALGVAAKVFTVKHMAKVEGRFNAINKRMTAALGKAHAAELKLQDETVSRWEKVKAQADIKAANRVIKTEDKRIKRELAHVKTMADRQKRATKLLKGEMKETFTGDTAQAFGEGIAGAFSDVLSADVGSIAGLIQKAGKGAQKKGLGMEESGAGKMSSLVGSMLGKFGKMIAVIGGVVAGIAALVKLVFSADEKIKEMNQTLLASGGAVGDIANNARGLDKTLGRVRDAAFEMRFNMDWGTVAKEQMEILAAWNEAGFTIKEMTQNIKFAENHMYGYQKATKIALIYSKLLGMSATDVAQQMAGFMEDLGLSLRGVQRGFAAVAEVASQSAYGTKRFSGMILQSTSGLSMYNVRLEQSAVLMLQLSKILGTKMGADFFASMQKGFSGESYEESFKGIQLMTKKVAVQMLGRGAEAAARSFGQKLSDAFAAGGPLMGDIQKIFEELKIDIDLPKLAGKSEKEQKALLDKFTAETTKALVKLDPKAQEKLLARLREKMPPEMVNTFREMLALTRSGTGKIVELLQAGEVTDPGTRIAMEIKKLESKLEKPLNLIEGHNLAQLMTAKNISGKTREEIMNFKRIREAVTGSWHRLEGLQKEYREKEKAKLTGGAKEAAEFKKFKDSMESKDSEIRKELAKTHSMTLENGKIVSATVTSTGVKLGKELEDEFDAIINADSALLGTTEKAMTQQETAALAVSRSTTEMSKYLRIGADALLKGIFGVVSGILDWLFGSRMNEEEQARHQALLKSLADTREIYLDQRSAVVNELSKLEGKYEVATAEEKEAIEKQMEKSQKSLKDIDQNIRQVGYETEQARGLKGAVVGTKTIPEWRKDLAAGKPATREKLAQMPVGRQERGLEAVGLSGEGTIRRKKEAEYQVLVDKFEEVVKGGAKTRAGWEEEARKPYEEKKQEALAGLKERTVKELPGFSKEMVEAIEAQRRTEIETGMDKMADMVAKAVSTKKMQKALEKGDKEILGLGTNMKKVETLADKSRKKTLAEDHDWLKRTGYTLQAKAQGKEKQLEAAKAVLRMAGITGPAMDKLAAQMVSKPEDLPKELEQALVKDKKLRERIQETAKEGGYGGMAQATLGLSPEKEEAGLQDFLIRVGRRGIEKMRIDPGDVMMGMKPGGAVANAGTGGGGAANVFHMYNDGPGILSTVIKAQKAGVLG